VAVHGAERAAAKERLIRIGKWQEVVAERDRLKLAGVEPSDAFWQAAQKATGETLEKFKAQLNVEPASLRRDRARIRTIERKEKLKAGDSPREVVQWVFESIADEGVTEKDAPTMGAWGLRQWARTGAAERTAFYAIWQKLLPTKSEIENSERREDDGRKLQAEYERIGRELRLAGLGPQDSPGKPEVP
jgi:hypothetical protein